jgi:hypothetical protein
VAESSVRRSGSFAFAVCFLLTSGVLAPAPLLAQAPQSLQQTADPPVRRWLDIQQLTFSTRFRKIVNSRDVTTANHLQYKESIRGRFNLDRGKRFTINAGFFSGSSFTSSWDNWGVGTGGDFDGHDHYLKQLYAAAIPVTGLELQAGSIYTARGEQDEWISYDDDGFIMGERATLRRPKDVWFDELTVTRGAIGPLGRPNISDRWDSFKHPDYTQALAVKRITGAVSASASYERLVGADVARGAVTLRLSRPIPFDTVRYEQYHRFNVHEASGFAVWADRAVSKHLRLQGGYVTVDQFYGGWNADRMQAGRRVFGQATIPIYGPFAASIFGTRAIDPQFTLPIKSRVDVVVSYDALDTLRRAGVF